MPASPDRAKAPARVPSVPLFLIPKVIQEQIKKKGESVFSIFVERRLHHQYPDPGRDVLRAFPPGTTGKKGNAGIDRSGRAGCLIPL